MCILNESTDVQSWDWSWSSSSTGTRSFEFAASSTMGTCMEEREGEAEIAAAMLFSREVEAIWEGERVKEESDLLLLEERDRNEHLFEPRFSSSTSLSNGEDPAERTSSSSSGEVKGDDEEKGA
jgi:hypothetical protein